MACVSLSGIYVYWALLYDDFVKFNETGYFLVITIISSKINLFSIVTANMGRRHRLQQQSNESQNSSVHSYNQREIHHIQLSHGGIAGVVVASVIILVAIIIGILFGLGVIKAGGGDPVTIPDADLFSCVRAFPGDPNGLYIRKNSGVASMIHVSNPKNFMDVPATTGFFVNFWYRMHSLPTVQTTQLVIPLFRRADNGGILWNCSLVISPNTSANPSSNHIAIQFYAGVEPEVVYNEEINSSPPFVTSLQSWHMVSYMILWNSSRIVQGFTAWWDGTQFASSVSGGASTIAMRSLTAIGLSIGSIDNLTIVGQQDVSTLSVFYNPGSITLANAAVQTMYTAGMTDLTYAIAAPNNLGAWVLGKGDAPNLYAYSERTSKCVNAALLSDVVIMDTPS